MKQPLRILVVEDEALIAMCLIWELKQAGYTVCKHLTSGEEAFIWAQQEFPDIILMDINLSGNIDGIEAARQIQAQHDIPVIFITGYPDRAVRERAESLNPLGFFVKPVQALTLKPLIDSIEMHEPY